MKKIYSLLEVDIGGDKVINLIYKHNYDVSDLDLDRIIPYENGRSLPRIGEKFCYSSFEYLVNEHQCDINFLSDEFEEVIINRESDPHEMFSYVESVILHEDEDHDWIKIFGLT